MKTNRGMVFAATLARRVYLPAKIRIRQWGALPSPRGPTVLITNHQHVDEGEIVFSRTFLRDPHIPLICVNSRRTFETGFFAARLPWTAPLTRNIDPSALWLRLGILPIENHLHSRKLISLAEEVRKKHGDLAVSEILPEDAVASIGLNGQRLSELWTPEYFERGQAVVKLAQLKQPYRREALENFRDSVARDIAEVVERVRAGATFYYTPEGDFTHDGRLRPLRNGLTDALLPIADPWLCAIAYDPFRGRRLSMLYRIVRPALADDITTSLAGSRAVTASALIGTYLCGVGDPFEADDARAAVRAQLAGLPPAAFVDPELARDPDACVSEALAVLVRMGILGAAGRRYALTGLRTDPRFPHVDDMLTYQRNMLGEIAEAARRLP